MTTADYQVRLDAFQGPLDLLLFLIRKNEVDVHDIPIASITDQFLRYIDDPDPRTGLATLDVEAAGEFLVMAATLVEIKSRMLAPARGPDDEAAASVGRRDDRQGGDPRADLVRQLLAYKKFRDAAGELDARHQVWADRHPNAPAALPAQPRSGPEANPAPGEAGSSEPASAEANALADAEAGAVIDAEDLQVIDLVEAFARIMATVDFSRVGEHHVHDDETPIELHEADILDVLARAEPGGEGVPLRSVFEGRTKPEAIGLFLALLELIRQRRVAISRTASAELSLSTPTDPPPPAPAAPPAAAPHPAKTDAPTA